MPEKRKNWNDLISGFRASDLVFLDESGCNTDMTRRYADSFGGSRAVDFHSAFQAKEYDDSVIYPVGRDITRYDSIPAKNVLRNAKIPRCRSHHEFSDTP